MGAARATGAANNVGDAARRLARTEGWYESRQPAQLALILALGGLWTWAVSLVWRHGRGQRGSRRSAAMVVVLTSLFLLGALRTISFHYSDSVLNLKIVGNQTVGNVLEITGLGATTVPALRESVDSRAAKRGTGQPTLQ